MHTPTLFDGIEFPVIVSLPSHNSQLALAAQECKVNAIKVHTNVEHKASGTRFGSWTAEREVICEIMSKVTCPVGLMPGAEETLNQAELEDAKQSGIAFIDIYEKHMPSWMMDHKVYRMVAIDSSFNVEHVRALESIGVDAIEASIIPSSEYGQKLTVQDLANYYSIVENVSIPVFVPSQKFLTPADLKELLIIGVRGVILGTIVLGNTPESFREKLPEYMAANPNRYDDYVDFNND